MNTQIRNVCIIAHVDHGKSTLADRFLELTGTVSDRAMRAQVLDQMELEQERGITIKLQPVQMPYTNHGNQYLINLIDTPGHVDFTYEVSRSLAAVEGAILLVDATQGVEAQTVSNLTLALEHDLAIIPVVNKIDLPNADPDRVSTELAELVGCSSEDVLRVSAKTGEGVDTLLAAVIERVPAPTAAEHETSRALVFDSLFDEYQGVIALVRVMNGRFAKGGTAHFLGSETTGDISTMGTFHPQRREQETLTAGAIGYIGIGRKDAESCRVGDTIALSHAAEPLPGYRQLQPMVFAGMYPKEGDDVGALRDAIEKINLSDAALTFQPERSAALGPGFRCGFLGMLHLEIIQQRIEREFSLDVVMTIPSVAYQVTRTDAQTHDVVRSPVDLGEPSTITEVREPIMAAQVITPKDRLGPVLELLQKRRGVYQTTEYLDAERVRLAYDVPLATLITNFYDKLKSVSSGYASLSYDFKTYAPVDVVRLDILVAGEIEEPLASIVYRDEAQRIGRQVVEQLKEVIPRQMFEVRLQAAIGSTILASERIPALRKDVTAKLYGGDVTRKRKLLEKQKRGKKRMRSQGKVDIPPEAYRTVLRRGST